MKKINIQDLQGFGPDALVTLSNDPKIINKLKKWHAYDCDILELIGEERRIIWEEDYDHPSDKELGIKYWQVDNDFFYPQWALVLIKPSPDPKFVEFEIHTNNTHSDSCPKIKFYPFKNYAIFNDDFEIPLEELINIGEKAKSYLNTCWKK
jgi:hypothetical protein